MPLPAGAAVSFGVPSATGAILLTGLKRDLHAGTTFKVTFLFQNAGQVSMKIPVQITPVPRTAEAPTPGDVVVSANSGG